MSEQNNTNDTNESSNSSLLSRSAQMIQAASPYLDDSTKKSLESIVHVTDFLETIQTFRQKGFSSMFSGLFGGRSKNRDTVSMANLNSQAAALDTESILRSIRPFCTQNEGSLIDNILNMLSMQKIFKMYQTMQSMMSMMNMTNDNANQSSDSTSGNQESSESSQDMNSYYDTYWNSFQNNTPDNVNAYGDGGTNENSEFSYYTGDENININNDNQEYNQNPNNYNYGQDPNSYSFQQDLNQDFNSNMFSQATNSNDYNQDTNPNGNNNDLNQSFNQDDTSSNNNSATNNTSASTSNTQMLEMLSSLIPPEQKSTFDAMKLLLESGMLK